jgi:hypothetical protein
MGIDGEDKGLCAQFCPEIFKEGTDCNKILKELRCLLGGERISEDYELYNIIEKTILDLELEQKEKDRLKKEHMKIELILQKNKWLAMQLSRVDPSEWNLFLDVLLIS